MNATSQLKIVTCSMCGIHYGLPANYAAQRRQDHETFYCPNGHSQYYPGKTELEKTKEKLARMTHCCDQKTARVDELVEELEHERRRYSGLKGAYTRERNRQK